MKIKPTGGNIAITPIETDKTTPSGLILPDTSKDQPEKGEVTAVGPGKLLDNGKRAEMEVKIGDKVLFKKYAPDEFQIDGKKLLIVESADIIAIIQ